MWAAAKPPLRVSGQGRELLIAIVVKLRTPIRPDTPGMRAARKSRQCQLLPTTAVKLPGRPVLSPARESFLTK